MYYLFLGLASGHCPVENKITLTGEFSPVGNRKMEDMEEFEMLEILKYIFSSFWVFSGTLVLIWSIGLMFTLIFYAIFGERKKK